ncbi:MAG TPA: helix-turn-helix domain-containing protein [Anaerolineales bacterium]|nr:helix-turn-helix domain-containing protein [Anaerolineales bacterium]
MSITIPSSTLEKFTTFGDLLRFLRRRVGLTQTELAQAVGYGHTQISRLEQNLRLPDIPTIEARFVPALGLEDEHKVVARLLDLAANIRREDAPALGLCPYKGLNYFDEPDADLFVGREALTAKLVERVISLASKRQTNEERFLAIVGASGSGKSSLVRAGLVPTLRWNQASTDWQIHIITPTAHPLESLAISLTAENASVTSTATLIDDFLPDARSLQIFVKRKLGLENGSRLLLVVDQFEELFALCRSEEERTSFIGNLLTAASESEGPFILVITLRADFYAHCANYAELREALAKHQEYIGAMNDEELRRAIEEPARRGRWEFEPGLVDLLLHDVGHEPGALPLLSHALLETWQRRRARTLTLSGYASSGGVRGAIAETAETVFTDQFTQEQRMIARRIFLRLTELSDESSLADTRRRAKFNELILKPEEAATTHAVLKALADARLITTSEDSAEVAHEALIREWPTLRSWLEDNREGLRLHRHLTESAQEWLLMNREPDLLYRGARLAQAREWAASHAEELNALEHEFLNAAIDHSERELAAREALRQRELDVQRQRTEEQKQAATQLRRRALFLSGALIVAAVLAVTAFLFSQRANQQAQLSTSRELAAASVSNLSVDPERSILLALQAVSVEHTAEAEEALHQAVLTSRVRLTLKGHTDAVTNVAVSPDGKRIATSSWDGTAKIWDAVRGNEILTLQGHSDEVWGVAFSPDGSQLITSSVDTTAIVWDADSGEALVTLSGHTASITRAVFSPIDGSRVATASDDGTVKIWDAKTGKELLTIIGLTGRMNGLAFSLDGSRIATAQDEGVAKIWDANSGEELLVLSGHTEPVFAVAFSPDGKYLATADFDGIIKVWNIQTGETLRTLTGHHDSAVYSVAFSADGLLLATSSSDNTAKIWDVATGFERFTLAGHTGFLFGAAFSPDGASLATASMDGTAKVWDLTPSHELFALTTNTDGVSGVAISPDGMKLVTAGQKVLVWDMVTGQRLYELTGHTKFVDSVKFSPDGTRLLTASQDETVRIWDLTSRHEILRLPAGLSGNVTVAFSPDGKRLAVTGSDNVVSIWDSASGKELLILEGHTASVVQLAFHSDGMQLASVSENGEDGVIIWDSTTGKELLVLKETGPVFGLAFSPNGKLLATSGPEGIAAIWDTTSGKQILSLFGHTRAIFGVAFTPDGLRLATASGDGTVKIWDAESGEELLTLLGHTGWVFGLAISPDGTLLATAGQDGISRIYLLNLEDLVELALSRVTRLLTTEECQKYLHVEACPAVP